MTRRRIVLELGETTTDTHCGDCPRRKGAACYEYDRWLPRQPWSELFNGGWLRLGDCRAAEAKEVSDAE